MYDKEYLRDLLSALRHADPLLHDFWTRFQKGADRDGQGYLTAIADSIVNVASGTNNPELRRAELDFLKQVGLCPHTKEEQERRASYDKKDARPTTASAKNEPDERSPVGNPADASPAPGAAGGGEEKDRPADAGALLVPDWREDTPPEYNWVPPGTVEAKE